MHRLRNLAAITAALLLTLLLIPTTLQAQATGRIDGRITRANGASLAGVIVVVNETGDATLTDANGNFTLNLPPGTYSILLQAGQQNETIQGIRVVSGQPTEVSRSLDWQLSFADSITVYSASRRAERIVDAPAAVSIVSQEEMELTAPTGQMPKLLESAPGVDMSQSGLYDINFNTRGFNSSLNRRILTLIDGRDPAVPFLGAQEWAAVSFPMDAMSSVELVRGPGSALYGANAFNGVLNMTTRPPKYNQGGKLTLTAGELNTERVDFRHGGTFGNELYYRVVGGHMTSDDFTRSRNAGVEYSFCPPGTPSSTYNCLPFERVPLALTEDEILYAGIRLDKHFESSNVLTVEFGTAELEGPTFQTGIGRVQVTDVSRPWARFNYNAPHYNILGYYDTRNADNQVALASGAPLYEDSSNLHLEFQSNMEFAGGRGRVVGGGAYHEQDIDTANPQGVQTLMAEAKKEDQQALFGQLEFDLTDSLRVVAAGRWDDSTLHDDQFSPKGSLVYSVSPNHTVRATYNEAFQVPNFSEFFLTAPAGAPINLGAIEQALAPYLGGVSLGFSAVPIMAFGNDKLDVEKIESFEIGYAGILGSKVYITLDYYQNTVSNFVTDLLPGANPAYAPYAPPSVLPAQVQQIILGALAQNLPPAVFRGFTNLANGQPALVLSYTNAGKVDTEGIEFGFNYYMSNSWVLDFNYAWFDWKIKEAAPDLLFPNAPENKYNVGLSYRGSRLDASLKYRTVEGFDWATGVFYGPVPSFDVLNFAANFRVSDRWTVGTNISNLTDSDHWESFGGDRLSRRSLGYLSYSW